MGNCHHFIIDQLTQDFEDITRAFRQLHEAYETMVRQYHLLAVGTWLPSIKPAPNIVCCEARKPRVVIRTVRRSVRSML